MKSLQSLKWLYLLHLNFIIYLFLFVVLLYINHIVVVTVPMALKGGNGRRIYNKVHYCYFCAKSHQKFGRHLLNDHKGEAEVIEICSVDISSEDGKYRRRQLINDLRRRGDFQHNMKVLRTGGELVV